MEHKVQGAGEKLEQSGGAHSKLFLIYSEKEEMYIACNVFQLETRATTLSVFHIAHLIRWRL